jgi:triphosphoribosyl-dephospho-CoA synthase
VIRRSKGKSKSLDIKLTPFFTPGDLVKHVCLIEANAPKPGCVHPGQGFADLEFEDFVRAAEAIAPVFDEAPERPLGETVLQAIRATRRVAASNVNLGIVLLLAPLAKARPDKRFRDSVREVLLSLTTEDSRDVYAAIRLASPGGLGEVGEYDVRGEPPGDLLKAMALAADRDLVARQYANGFQDVFEAADWVLKESSRKWWELMDTSDLAVRLHLNLLARHPDSLIARKCGLEVAQEASRRARAVLDAGWPASERSKELERELDAWLRADGNRRNPGTTADLVTATLYVLTYPLIIDPNLAL